MAESESHSVVSDCLQPHGLNSPGNSPGKEYWSGLPFPSSGNLPNPGIKPRSPALQTDSLPAEPQAKPKNTGVGSLSLLQLIFPTQESNLHCRGLLHYRQILYQLSSLSPLSFSLSVHTHTHTHARTHPTSSLSSPLSLGIRSLPCLGYCK